MRILAANKKDWTHPKSGGAEVNLKETLTRLDDRGHEVHLFTSKYPNSPAKEEIDGVKIHRYGLKGRTNELFILSLGQLYLNGLIQKLNPDILYLINSIMTWIPVWKRDKTVIGIHHLNGKTLLRQMEFPLNYIGYLAEKMGLLLSRSREKVTGSPEITQVLVEKGLKKNKITEIRHGVDSERYTQGKEADKPNILYLGRLEYSKGVDLLPSIHENIQEEFGECNLEIAGFGRREEDIEEFTDNNQSVTFHGYVSEERKKKLLQSAWVLLTPSRKEGWGLTVAEAAASGTPAVGFKTGGLQSSIEDGETGRLVPSNPEPEQNTKKFARAVTELLNDTEERKRLGENAVEKAGDWSWDNAAKNLEELFRQVNQR